jgi:hypothetical protein
MIKRAFVIATAGVVAALAAASVSAGANARAVKRIDDVKLELVGQVINSPPGVTPGTSVQYGYLAHLHGLPIFKEGTQDEKTALFTFYTQTTTMRIISNGPLRVIRRQGTLTIYADPSANGDFASPDSFRDGTPILVARLRQQVIVDTASGAFTAQNLNTISSTSAFEASNGTLHLGKPGDQFRTVITGHVNASGLPSAYMAGYAFSDPPRRDRV